MAAECAASAEEAKEWIKKNRQHVEDWAKENLDSEVIQAWLKKHPKSYQEIVHAYENGPSFSSNVRLPGMNKMSLRKTLSTLAGNTTMSVSSHSMRPALQGVSEGGDDAGEAAAASEQEQQQQQQQQLECGEAAGGDGGLPAESNMGGKVSKFTAKWEIIQDPSLLVELVHDIVQEIDLVSLLHKILQNVLKLLSGDVASLFLVDEARGCLVSKVFDVTSSSSLADLSGAREITVPLGKGIVGHVTDTGETVNIVEAYKDDRFNQDVDKQTGYKTNTMLCMPIRLSDGTIIGAATVVNKKDGAFEARDEHIFETYLNFCGIGIRNAQLFEMSMKSVDKCEVLLQLAKNIFQEVDMDVILQKIMEYAADLVVAERCSVFIVDEATQELYAQVFDVQKKTSGDGGGDEGDGAAAEGTPKDKKSKEIRFPIGKGIAGSVAQSGETLVIQDAYADPRFNDAVDKQTGFVTRNILCIPVYNNKNTVIGVAMLVNKANEQRWTEDDVGIMEAFSVYCGLGIHNALLYHETKTMLQRNRVALDVLSYHSTGTQAEIKAIEAQPLIVAAEVKLHEFSFNARAYDPDGTVRVTMAMARDLGFMNDFMIPERTMLQFLTSVRKNYRDVVYHNWMHGFSVAHMAYAMMKQANMTRYLSKLEMLAVWVGCICHDLDHRGTNNAFQTASGSPLGLLYGTSTMEHHHFDTSITILSREGHNIFGNLAPDEYTSVIKLMEHAILATDLALYFKMRSKFQDMVAAKMFKKSNKEDRELLRSMIMTSADVSAITKPWKSQRSIALIVYSEFFEQGDLDKARGAMPPAMMDREKTHELPKMQIGFIDFICMPVYKMLAEFDPALKPLLDGVARNRACWDREAKKGDFEAKFDGPAPTANFLPDEDETEEEVKQSMERMVADAQKANLAHGVGARVRKVNPPTDASEASAVCTVM